ncbi:M20/M25/M40 family metallo-hydrolase [Peribacillus glennii]|uniref:M20/M25/M40 family metallo-hydrolase n=1 Tax=Peribacillus glennii TaxID=2303991 RepID=A0A372LAW1_9BACI|nr:M20/M25/M40 family metallo-hydrolase [Peribacillus glennii]RFU62919.1 M20/M25/M40 family metallo-hydrolase [Peribacillus glennii]
MDKTAYWNNREQILSLIRRLVRVPSIAGTADENVMAEELLGVFKEIPYFRENPDCLFEKHIEGDSLKRKAIAALLKGKKGKSNKTVILLSHFDVVGVEDYGYLKDYAFNPDLYTQKLKDTSLPEDIMKELHSGNWLFARGIMDMKAGLALHISLLEKYAAKRDFEGNILLLSTPDEERNSEGMFAAVALLTSLKRQYGLEYCIGICSEPSFASFPGDESKYVYLGSVGKLLPMVFCNGKETHVGEPLEGVNASWMAAVFTANMELSILFIDQDGDERNPPPTCLKLTDLKEQYNVQTPTDAYVLYNVLTLRQTPGEVMDKLKLIAEQSSLEILGKIKNMYNSRVHSKLDHLKPRVYSYSYLYMLGKERFGEDFEREMADVHDQQTDTQFDYRLKTVEIAKKISGYFQDLSPFYLIMFAPPYYPHVSLLKDGGRDEKIRSIAEGIIHEAKDVFRQEIKLKQFFTGLSDVSYCRLLDADRVIPSLKDEMPLYGKKYKMPLKEIEELNIPTINLGPFGKDAHKRTERLELSFSLDTLPHLLKYTVDSVLKDEA